MSQHVTEWGNIQEKWLANKFMNKKLIREIRIDGIAIGLVFGLSAFCYRGHWLLWVSLLGARTVLISFMDNVYHYGSTLNVTSSGHNLWLPRILSTLILNFNFHRVHHRNPAVPWAKLPELFVENSDKFDRNLFTTALNQLRGPVPLSDLIDHTGAPLEVKPYSAVR